MLEEKIYQRYFAALKDHKKHEVDFLSFIRGQLKNAAIDLKKEKLDDNEVLSVLKKEKKRLQESKEIIASSGRSDVLQSLEKELAILDEYLPKPLEENELVQVVDQAIADLGATSMKDMGKVIKEVLAKVGVRADAKTVSNLVKNKLSSR